MKGGGKNYLPLPPSVTNGQTLCEQFDFVTMTAHGIQDGNVFIVPENTYIMFRGPAGVSIERMKRLDTLLAQFRFLKPGESQAAWCQRVYDLVSSKQFFKDILFSPEDPFQPGSVSIYEPGDVIQNVGFELKNMKYPYGLIGVWDLPLPTELLEQINGANALFEDTLQSLQQLITGPGAEQAIKERLDEILRAREIALISHPNNKEAVLGLGTGQNLHISSLHEVIHNLKKAHGPMPAQFNKPYTFLLVESCRQAPELGNFHGIPEFITALETNNAPHTALETVMKSKYFKPGTEESLIKEAASAMAPILERKRRLSLNVRSLPEVCYRSLFLLSKASLAGLGVAPNFVDMKRELLEGGLIPTVLFEEMVAPARAKNIVLSKLPKSRRFFIGEGFTEQDTDNLGIVVDFTPGVGVNGGAGPGFQYTVKVFDGTGVITKSLVPSQMNKMSQEDFSGIVMSLSNNIQRNLKVAIPNLPGTAIVASGSTIKTNDYGWRMMIESQTPAQHRELQVLLEQFPHVRSGRTVKFRKPNGELMKLEVLSEVKVGPIPSKTNTGTYPTVKVRTEGGKDLFVKIADLLPESTTAGGSRGKSRSFLSGKLCRCIKRVRKTVKVRKGSQGGKESAAIGICVRSVLGKRGRTLRKFKCGKKAYVETQDPLKKTTKK